MSDFLGPQDGAPTEPSFTASVKQIGRWRWYFKVIERPAGTWLKFIASDGRRFGRKRALRKAASEVRRLRRKDKQQRNFIEIMLP